MKLIPILILSMLFLGACAPQAARFSSPTEIVGTWSADKTFYCYNNFSGGGNMLTFEDNGTVATRGGGFRGRWSIKEGKIEIRMTETQTGAQHECLMSGSGDTYEIIFLRLTPDGKKTEVQRYLSVTKIL